LTGILPIISANIAYLVAAQLGHLSWCIPYLDGCASISATGRQAPESLFFRATMIPAAVLMMAYWRLNYEWLLINGDRNSLAGVAMLWLGTTAAVFLVIYTVALGHIGEEYALQRRIGVTLFFAFSYLAQLLLLGRYQQLLKQGTLPALHRIYQIKILLCTLLLIVGLAQPAFNALHPDQPYRENIIEWNFALLLHLYFIITYFAWKSTGFNARFTTHTG
ncbi:MAG: hypothetical protein A2V90_01200, partial [Gammaproteobacteria bacterium RBG_16_57_12]